MLSNGIFKIKASILVFPNPEKKYSIPTGIMTAFHFPGVKSMVSGGIRLLNGDKIEQGQTAIAEIFVLTDQLMGDYKVGTRFTIGGPGSKIGEGEILEILGLV